MQIFYFNNVLYVDGWLDLFHIIVHYTLHATYPRFPNC